MTYLFAAFCVTWLVIFLYVRSIARRQRTLDHDIELLRQTVEQRRDS
ncbi:MAG: CcmD family protein [Deltaproteobacteria bacterium]|nr:CcmD family protein [Deltaproteobacteria bacterium]